MGRSTVHYADSETNNILKRLHNKLRPAGTPVERVEYIIELLLLRIFEAKIKQDETFKPLRKLFEGENYRLLFSHLLSLNGEQVLSELNKNIFPFYSVILSKSRTVISGNLPQKMQDQLVLMEEIFANSNFTNNVKGGVIAEIIGMVNEIDEKYILKTDLLGDAIESALSETGGTKNLGLYRTPDHIRQMMVEMVDPDFTDTIFDPACGTAGFLFDAYDYVIEKAQKTRKMPSESVANMFYRSGIGGIEYQGRIRKMAAVNMYIRGLNPHNIDQGDSLKMYDHSRDAGSKSVVIANPPFGAERDQPAYPNVWEEYSRESETTILFVKLMFDLLKQNGRCVVVVSEGFLTWGQNSACALRKILLNDSNLRAVISLPQGVFVSKSGQGAKTSILYFEKGQPTDFVWYYKIENDGFSMGTNRKAIVNGQIPELLELFNKIKQGKKSQDTKHSFCISKEQIETLDPRIAERIKKEVSEKTKEKNIKKLEKLVVDLDKKLKDKKISKEIRDEKLWQFDNIIEGQIDNEVAKAIERAHSFHFNLQNYRSNLSSEQIKDWQDTLKVVEIKNGLKIEKQYQELQKTEPKTALQIIASFDTKNALQMDIARDYLSKLDKKELNKNDKLKKLEEILRKGFKYPIVSLKELITVNDERIKPLQFPDTEFTVLGVSNQTGVFINEKLSGSEIKQGYFKVYKNQFCYNPYRINVGSIGFSEFDIENQIISGAYNVFGCNETLLNPKYLEALFKTKKFLEFVSEKANGGVRMDFKIESMQEWQIPLPPIEVQKEIVEQINKYQNIIDGAKQIVNNYSPTIKVDSDWHIVELGNLFLETKLGLVKDKSKQSNDFPNPYIKMDSITADGYLDLKNVTNVEATKEELEKYTLNDSDFIYNTRNAPNLVGKSSVYHGENGKYLFNNNILRIRFKREADPDFINYYLNTIDGKNKIKALVSGTTSVAAIYQKNFATISIPLPPIDIQKEIVSKIAQERKCIDSASQTVKLFEYKIKETIDELL